MGAPGAAGNAGVPGVKIASGFPIGQGLLSKGRELVGHFDWVDSLRLIDAQAQSSLTSNHQEILDQCFW